MFYTQQPAMAELLADRVVNENVTVAAIRKLVHDYMRPIPTAPEDRERTHNRRANATIVQNVTANSHQVQRTAPIKEAMREGLRADSQESERTAENQSGKRSNRANQSRLLNKQRGSNTASTDNATVIIENLTLLEEASEVLIFLASRAEELPLEMISEQILDQIETALKELRRSFARRAPEKQLDIAPIDD